MIIIDRIRTLISEGETEKSLNELYTYVVENNAAVIDNLVLLKSRMRSLANSKINGTIDRGEEARERAEISVAILDLLPMLKPEYAAPIAEKVAETYPEDVLLADVLNPAEGTLLYNVLNRHGGYAIWKSVYNETNGQSTFRLESNKVCQEIKNGQVVCDFEIVANSPRYVTLFDMGRQMFLRLGETTIEFNNEGEDEWYDLYEGAWIMPPDALWTASA